MKIAGFEIFQSTPSAWRETTATLSAERNVPYFNPLPPHGGRQTNCGESRKQKHFNPLPPHGGRLTHCHILSTSRTFQSTPSAWRETPRDSNRNLTGKFQSTPSAWRETTGKAPKLRGFHISIHSLRMEGDRDAPDAIPKPSVFQSTPSAWRETTQGKSRAQRNQHFNPLPPHGGRPI